MTYSRFGSHSDLRVNKLIVIDIPVAKGRIIQSLIQLRPMIFCIKLRVIDLLNCTIRLDPIAFGWSALTSPDLPIPWPSEKFLFLTILEKILASRSPTPQLPEKLLESIKAILFISSSMVN